MSKWYKQAQEAVNDLHEQGKGVRIDAVFEDEFDSDRGFLYGLFRWLFQYAIDKLTTKPVSDVGDHWYVHYPNGGYRG